MRYQLRVNHALSVLTNKNNRSISLFPCILWSMVRKIRDLISIFGAFCICVTVAAILVSGGNFLWIPSSFATSSTDSTEHRVMNNFRAIFVTTPNLEVAKKIAHGLVSNKLAACVNIIPQITSVYEWEGKVNEDSELLLMIKTEADKFDKIDKFVKDNHPYDVPEVIAVPIEQGSENYLKWIKETIGSSASSS